MQQAIDYNLFIENRNKLIFWQNQQWNRDTDGIRLHLGSGKVHLDKYINVDLYSNEADKKEDIRYLPSFKPNSVTEIVAHHVLEHIPIRDVFLSLQRWYEILAPNGTLEIGLPDFEIEAQLFLEASEKDRWEKHIWKIFGGQTEDPKFSMAGESTPYEYFEYADGQTHRGGFSLGFMIRMLEDIGFKMIDAYNYDAFGSASLFVYCFKPEPNPSFKSVLEQDCVIGTFTNKITYIRNEWKSAQKFIPQIPFITRYQRGDIVTGMTLLREDFLKTKKRYFCFLDDDVQFLNPNIIKNALEVLVSNKAGIVSTYSTFNPIALSEPYGGRDNGLVSRKHRWATGYFILCDGWRVGDILPDLSLPWKNQSVDTSYSCSALANGFEIFINKDYMYHQCKNTKYFSNVINDTNAYLLNKWGNFYFSNIIYDGNVIEWPIGSV